MGIGIDELRHSARQVMGSLQPGADESEAWAQIAELGWLMLEMPEESGGLGMGLPAACALHEELGRILAAVPYLSASLSIDALCQAGLADGGSLLERLACGADYVAVPLAGSTVSHDNGDLSGVASAVASADRAGHILVWTEAMDLIALLPTDAVGVECIERPTWDRTRRLYDVRLEAVSLCRR